MNAPSTEASRNRAAVVTGAGQGIGAAIAHRLAEDGYDLYVNDVDAARAEAVVESIQNKGGRATAAVADVTDSAAIDALFDKLESAHGMADVLVNNAGVGGNAAIRNISDDYWDRILGIDLDAVLYASRRALAAMREARSGAIVNITSRAWLGWWGQGAYAAAKAGVVGLTRALAVEFASRNVRINAVAPGLIETPLLLDRSEEALERLLKSVPLGRLGTVEDVASAVSFLASNRARAVTGQVLYVCGGKSVYAYPDWPDSLGSG